MSIGTTEDYLHIIDRLPFPPHWHLVLLSPLIWIAYLAPSKHPTNNKYKMSNGFNPAIYGDYVDCVYAADQTVPQGKLLLIAHSFHCFTPHCCASLEIHTFTLQVPMAFH